MTILEEYKKHVKERNDIQSKMASEFGLSFVENTVADGKIYKEDGKLTDYGSFVTTQLYQGETGNSGYDAYVEKARSMGNNFMSYEQYISYNQRQVEESIEVIVDEPNYKNNDTIVSKNKNVSRETNLKSFTNVIPQVIFFVILIKLIKGVFR